LRDHCRDVGRAYNFIGPRPRLRVHTIARRRPQRHPRAPAHIQRSYRPPQRGEPLRFGGKPKEVGQCSYRVAKQLRPGFPLKLIHTLSPQAIVQSRPCRARLYAMIASHGPAHPYGAHVEPAAPAQPTTTPRTCWRGSSGLASLISERPLASPTHPHLQRPSKAISGHQRPTEGAIRGHPRPSEAIRGHPRSSKAIRGRHRPSQAVTGRHRP
jgi:hypothetical protein